MLWIYVRLQHLFLDYPNTDLVGKSRSLFPYIVNILARNTYASTRQQLQIPDISLVAVTR